MKKLPQLYSQEGITIVEIMVAIIILSTGFLAVAKLQSVSVRSVSWAQKKSTAILLAQSYLESIPFNKLDDYHGASKKKTVLMDKNQFFVTTLVDPLGTATQKKVEIKVAWDAQELSFETLRFQ
ncbi:MAG: hypothetical protein HQK75_05700 [Candidatus Magnetomorum sp.]|nr:hypothetical protein [Candidatus Magnetomorum sp.]